MRPTTLRRFGSLPANGAGLVLAATHPSIRGARTIFPSRVYDPDEVDRVIKTGHQSRKIGKVVTKGPRKGWPLFTLTLEERATCPAACLEWRRCYGNNMQAAERITHGPALIDAIEQEVAALASANPRGFLVRLHILGDFWSPEYVAAWSALLRRFPALHVFGFTAHQASSTIGRAVSRLTLDHGWSRAAIRFSGAPHPLRAARVITPGARDSEAILCPAQTGGTACCATCALCWQSERSIAFRSH